MLTNTRSTDMKPSAGKENNLNETHRKVRPPVDYRLSHHTFNGLSPATNNAPAEKRASPLCKTQHAAHKFSVA